MAQRGNASSRAAILLSSNQSSLDSYEFLRHVSQPISQLRVGTGHYVFRSAGCLSIRTGFKRRELLGERAASPVRSLKRLLSGLGSSLGWRGGARASATGGSAEPSPECQANTERQAQTLPHFLSAPEKLTSSEPHCLAADRSGISQLNVSH
ncbi:hypothetical protein AAFF_G00093220 [Aldrovandia affinis]|uniref:Uncharacterized protein n=1 Tax=Aldrovandia affinis TaxID=143900 RepID=A0AAD7T2U0_9TELE|nr:hypothetical protein AAFF_G00093220 [Aldrovandia affinis]